jgi:aspartate carbamoyltransferase catalytic subunit
VAMFGAEVEVLYQTRIRPERVVNTPLDRYSINPRAMYFLQAANGLYLRMALLTMLPGRD